jgi:fibrillarin-like rRNA methylase
VALIIPAIQKEMEAAIMAALQTKFAKETVADPSSYEKMAAAIAQGVTQVLIKHIQTSAQVLPGIATAGSPASHVSVSPGMIF